MANLTNKQKREWAELLYTRTDMQMQEIAEKVGVHKKTMSIWKEQYGWQQIKSSFFITKGQELHRIYAQLANLNDAIHKRDEGERYASPREADTISKLASAAKNLENDISISDIIDVFLDFIEWLREADFNMAQQVSDLQDAFIKHKLSKGNK